MSYVVVVSIQLFNLALAFFLSHFAVRGDGGAGGIYLVQAVSGFWIALSTVVALLLCRAGRARSGIKASLLSLPALYLFALLVLAALSTSIAFSFAFAVLALGWAGVVVSAKRRLSRISPTTLSEVIVGSKFTAFEWVFLLAVGFMAIFTWYQLLKATTT